MRLVGVEKKFIEKSGIICNMNVMAMPEAGKSKKRVLIAEDEKSNADAITDFVRFAFPDWILEYCTTGADTVRLALENPPDVMILDIALGDAISGIEVIKRLSHSGLRDKPRIVLITALGMYCPSEQPPSRPWMEHFNEQEKELVSAFFLKPFGWNKFLTALAKAADVIPPEAIQQIAANE